MSPKQFLVIRPVTFLCFFPRRSSRDDPCLIANSLDSLPFFSGESCGNTADIQPFIFYSGYEKSRHKTTTCIPSVDLKLFPTAYKDHYFSDRSLLTKEKPRTIFQSLRSNFFLSKNSLNLISWQFFLCVIPCVVSSGRTWFLRSERLPSLCLCWSLCLYFLCWQLRLIPELEFSYVEDNLILVVYIYIYIA